MLEVESCSSPNDFR